MEKLIEVELDSFIRFQFTKNCCYFRGEVRGFDTKSFGVYLFFPKNEIYQSDKRLVIFQKKEVKNLTVYESDQFEKRRCER